MTVPEGTEGNRDHHGVGLGDDCAAAHTAYTIIAIKMMSVLLMAISHSHPLAQSTDIRPSHRQDTAGRSLGRNRRMCPATRSD